MTFWDIVFYVVIDVLLILAFLRLARFIVIMFRWWRRARAFRRHFNERRAP